jgi:hypothetical protein
LQRSTLSCLRASGIVEHISKLENQSPDQFQMPAGVDFDEWQLKTLPAIKKTGAAISRFLLNAERLATRETQPKRRSADARTRRVGQLGI